MLGLGLAPTRLLLPQLGALGQSRGGAWMGTGTVLVSQGERTRWLQAGFGLCPCAWTLWGGAMPGLPWLLLSMVCEPSARSSCNGKAKEKGWGG